MINEILNDWFFLFKEKLVHEAVQINAQID